MEGTRVASRYAKSFIDLSLEQGQLEQAYNDMTYVAEVCKGSHELVVFLKSPVIKTDAKQEVLKKLFGGKLSKISDGYIHLITAKKREKYLSEIAQEFISQYKTHKKILTAVITTANGIDDSIRKEVMALVKGSTNQDVVLEERINKDLIGGFVVRVGDKQVDASIARKLQNLKQNFNENPFVKEF